MGDVAVRILKSKLFDVNRSIDLYIEQVTYHEAELKTAQEDLEERKRERDEIVTALKVLEDWDDS